MTTDLILLIITLQIFILFFSLNKKE